MSKGTPTRLEFTPGFPVNIVSGPNVGKKSSKKKKGEKLMTDIIFTESRETKGRKRQFNRRSMKGVRRRFFVRSETEENQRVSKTNKFL